MIKIKSIVTNCCYRLLSAVHDLHTILQRPSFVASSITQHFINGVSE